MRDESRAEHAVPLARALVAGGLPAIEVTLRTKAALDALRAIIAEVPQAVAGIGTVTKAADVSLACDAGAAFLASPGTPPSLAKARAAAPIPALPGCSSASEATMLMDFGFPVVKFFPAESSGGVRWLKSIAAPLPALRFCPTGGIDADNAAAYLALPNVIAIGGSWVAPQDAVAAGDFARITTLARAAAGLRNKP